METALLIQKQYSRILTPIEMHIIAGRIDGKTFREIGESLDVSKQRVKQIEERVKWLIVADFEVIKQYGQYPRIRDRRNFLNKILRGMNKEFVHHLPRKKL